MSPITHFIGSWLVASVATNHSRDRKLVTLAGILPDVDGLGMVVDVVGGLMSGTEITFNHYQQYHHYLLHGWPGALALIPVLTCLGRERWRVLLLCLLTFHLHLLCDFLGSRGPSPDDLWPIAYGEPFFRHPKFVWSGQWKLGGWQNQIVSVVIFAVALWQATKKGCSFVECFNRRMDAIFVGVLQKWRTKLGAGRNSN